jgi:glycine cleavage system protein P-like pyridoxal-binding family
MESILSTVIILLYCDSIVMQDRRFDFSDALSDELTTMAELQRLQALMDAYRPTVALYEKTLKKLVRVVHAL